MAEKGSSACVGSSFALVRLALISLFLFGVLFSRAQIASAFASDDYRPDGRYDTKTGQVRLSPDPVTGSLPYKYVFDLPPGRTQATTPDLELDYSSVGGEDISPVGYGWSLNIPFIERLNKTGTQDLYSSYYFYSSLDGEIASSTQSTTTPIEYRAKSDTGSFRVYQFNTDGSWTAEGNDGLLYTFGTSTLSRVDNPDNSGQVYRWMLEKVEDTNGNYIKYEYYKESGQIYPLKISYTGSGSSEGVFSVNFELESRSDVATSSRPGFSLVDAKRVSRIEVQQNSSWVARYDFSYEPGDNGHRDLLGSIAKTGRDESLSTITLPATAFGYTASTTGWTTDSNWESPVYFSNGADLGVRLADVNGDGLVDIVKSLDLGGSTQAVYINTGTGWSLDSGWSVPVYFSNGADTGARFFDVNGDGYVDIIKAYNGSPSINEVYLNNATTSGWTLSSWSFPAYFTNGTADQGVRVGDVNGDGLPDVVRACDCSPAVQEVYLNNGSGWTLDTGFSSSTPVYISNGADRGTELIDVNGDGLADFFESYSISGSTSTKTFINNGHGWTEDPAWDSPQDLVNDGHDTGTRFVDLNSDGLPDVVRSQNISDPQPEYAYINTGHGWVQNQSWVVPDFLQWGYVDAGARLSDVNGDNVVDFVQAKDVGGIALVRTMLGNGKQVDLLTTVASAEGATTTISYKGSAQYQDGSGNLLNPELPMSLPVVSSIAQSDGFNTTGTTTYSYQGGDFYYNGPHDRKVSGFNVVTEVTPAGDINKTYLHQGNTTDSSDGEYGDEIAKLGKSYQITTSDQSGNVYKKTINRWDAATTTNQNRFVFLAQSLELDYDGNGTHKDKADSYSYDLSRGVPIQKKSWGEVTGSTDGTFSDTGSDLTTIDYTYATSSVSEIFPVASETQYNSSSVKVKETKHYYDDQSFGQSTFGNETKVERWISGSSYASTTRAYNSYGLVTEEHDPLGNITTYTYDPYDLHVATNTDPLSHTNEYYYDYTAGKPKQIVNGNGHVFQTVFDALDRVVEIKQPDIATPSSLVDKTTYSYVDTVGSRRVTETNFLSGSNSTILYTYLDGLDRVVQKRQEAEEAGAYVTRDYVYDSSGRSYAESLPYFSAGSSKTSASTNDALFTFTLYDPLNRITESKTVVGTTTKVYDQWTETDTDVNGHPKDYTYDAFGRLASVQEHNGGSTYTTTYTYNPIGNLTGLTDASDNIRAFTYDGLGRRLTAEDLHASSDATYGSWSYSYDVSGNLISKTNPKGQVVEISYDSLNRPTSENYTGQAGVEAEYAYDSCGYGVLRLCTATSTGAVTSYSYDPLGNIATENKVISSSSFITQFTHDRVGNLASIVYPDASEVQYSYNGAGLLESIAQKESGGSFSDLVTNLDYAPTGKVSYKEFANGVQSTYTYNPSELYRLENIFTLATSTGGGGGMAFSGAGFWSSLVLAVEKLPLAVLEDLDLGALVNGEAPTGEAATSSESSNQEEAQAENTATTTQEVIDDVEDAVVASSTEDIIATTTEESISENESEGSSSQPEEQVSVERSSSLNEDQNSSKDEVSTTTPVAQVKLSPSTTTPKDIEAIPEDGDQNEKSSTQGDIIVKLENKTDKERAAIKGRAIATATATGRTERAKYTIEIVSIKPIDGGVEAYVRAWTKNGKQIGFGRDGSVDMERFQIFNPPVLVADPKGSIVQEADVLDQTNPDVTKHVTRVLRVDPREALLQVIEQNLSVMRNIHGPENIVKGKKGKTVSTFYPNAGNSTAPVDGTVFRESVNETWSTIRNGSGTAVGASSWYNSITSYYGNGGSQYNSLSRSLFGFDTSPLGIGAPKTIDSATLSIRGIQKGGSGASESTVVIDRNVPSNEGQLSSVDFDKSNWDGVEQASNRITYNSWDTTDYNNFTLNATGTANINVNGNSWFGTRGKGDFDDITPSSAVSVYIDGYFADRTGTSDDPKLVVEHTSTNHLPSAPTSLEAEGQTNPEHVTDSTPELSAIYNDSDSADVATSYRIQVATSTSFASLVWDSSKATLASSTPQGTRIAGVSYAGSGLASSTTYYWRIKFWDYYDEEGDWSTATSTFSLASQAAPGSPTSLQVGGQTNPTNITDSTPDFSAIYQDSDYGAVATSYQIQVATANSFAATSTIWDSGKNTLASSTPAGTRIADVSYAGSTLLPSTTYYWRVRFWDDSDIAGAWSTENATFSEANPSGVVLQHVTLSYDGVGNVVGITDTSDTSANRAVVFGYDDLNRLTSASTTAASSNPFSRTYSYDAIGNITNKSDIGAYTYGGIGYANPHAVTSIYNGATTTYAYDENGNLTSEGSDFYDWDYENRLTSVGSGTATSTFYVYDQGVQRVSKQTSSSTILYPNRYYNTDGTTNTKYVFADNTLVGTLATVGATTTIEYVHPDHLNSTNVVTDSEGGIARTLDYYPYGSERIDSGTSIGDREFIGERLDDETGLSYLNARYYEANRGQFLSEDPSHLAIGDPNKVLEMTGQSQQTYLMDPQALNSYSYARDNPIVRSDPTGRAFGVDDAAGFIGGGVIGSGLYAVTSLASGQPVSWSGAAGAFVTGGVIGWGAVNTPETLGASNAISASIVTGLIGGYYGNLTTQGIDVATGKQSSINYTQAQTNGLLTAGTNGLLQGVLPSAKIPGLSAGPNSASAIGKSNLTKLTNGTISNISVSSGIKSAVGSQASDLYRTFVGGIIDTVKSALPSDKKK